MKIYDQHVHTKYSPDSKAIIEDYLILAIEKRNRYFVSTDHVDYDMVSSHINSITDFHTKQNELETLKLKYPNITILDGIEMGYRHDYVDEMKEILKKYHFDIVLLSVHDNGIIDFYRKDHALKYGLINTMNIALDYILESITNIIDYNVLAHIDYTFRTIYSCDNSLHINLFENQLIKIFQKLIEDKKTLEINTKVQQALVDDHLIYILKLYKSVGGERLTISSDCHDVRRFEEYQDKYIDIIKKYGFNKLVYFVNKEEYFIDI